MSASPRSPSWRDVLLLVVLGAALFLPGLGSRDLWNPDEPRYAEVAREMLERGDFLVPHLNGELYQQKPPLLFWAICLASLVRGGVDEVAARLPSALAAIAALVLVFRMGLRLFGRRSAWFAVAAFATCAKLLWQGRIGQIDMLLVCLVTLAMDFWTRGFFEEGGGRSRDFCYRGFFVAAGLATLAKGPVGLLPPLFSILAFLGLIRDRETLRQMRIPTGLLLWAGVVLAWFLPAAISGGREYFLHLLVDQNVGRYADPWHHFRPWYYYLKVIPGDFFPWSLLLPASFALLLPARWRELVTPERRAFLFCFCWFLVTVIFFSLSPAKRTVYVLTMYPALALMVGFTLDRLARGWPAGRRWVALPWGATALLLAAGAAYLPTLAAREADQLAVLGQDLPGILIALLILLAAALAAGAVFAWRGNYAAGAGTVAGAMAVLALTAVLTVLPRFDAVKSARPLSQLLLEQMAPGESYGLYPRIEPPFLFYTGKFADVLTTEEELRTYLQGPGRRWLLIDRPSLEQLKAPPPAREIARDADEKEGYVLLLGGE